MASVVMEPFQSAELFRPVLDVRIKRGAELQTDHHLVVCKLHLEKPPGPIEMIQRFCPEIPAMKAELNCKIRD